VASSYRVSLGGLASVHRSFAVDEQQIITRREGYCLITNLFQRGLTETVFFDAELLLGFFHLTKHRRE